jgi:hypothetical protein
MYAPLDACPGMCSEHGVCKVSSLARPPAAPLPGTASACLACLGLSGPSALPAAVVRQRPDSLLPQVSIQSQKGQCACFMGWEGLQCQ